LPPDLAQAEIAFASSYGVFSPGKTGKLSVPPSLITQSNVKIAGHHSGIMNWTGRRHPPITEDIA